MQCSPVQWHVRLSFKRPRAIDLTLPVKTVPAEEKRRMQFDFFGHFCILPVYGNVRSLAVFPQYGASSSCIGSPGFDNDRCFFSRQSLNVMMESGFMMKEHLIERGTFGLRFC